MNSFDIRTLGTTRSLNYQLSTASYRLDRETLNIWVVLSFLTLITGCVWRHLDSNSEIAIVAYILGLISSLLAVGYYSTPSHSIYGKIAFTCVIIVVSGMIMKILHWVGANEVMVIGLAGIGFTFAFMKLKGVPW